jgi:hypothetical protein
VNLNRMKHVFAPLWKIGWCPVRLTGQHVWWPLSRKIVFSSLSGKMWWCPCLAHRTAGPVHTGRQGARAERERLSKLRTLSGPPPDRQSDASQMAAPRARNLLCKWC